jgi:CHRD domain
MRRIQLLLVVLAGALTLLSGSALAAVARTAADPPVNHSLPTISGTDRESQTLTATNGSWGGAAPISYAYRWQDCNSNGSSCSSIGGATNQNYVLSHSDIGKTIRVNVTATNRDGTSQALSAATGVVANLGNAPASTTQPNPSGTPQDGLTLTVDNGTWSGLQPITYSYQWQTCTTVNSVCTNLTGATGSSFLIGTSQVGTLLRATVTATNSIGKSSVSSNLTTLVLAKLSAPVSVGLPAITGTASVGQRLQASAGTWTGTGTNTYAYQWSRCNSSGSLCSNVSGATGQSYGVGQVDLGMSLRVTVTATNAAGPTSARSASTPIRVAVASKLNAVMRSNQEVTHPKGVSTRAAGHFTATVIGKTLTWTLTFASINRPSFVSLNTGIRGVNGVAFKTLCRSCASSMRGTAALTAAQVDTLMRGGAYVNIHTLRDPAGAIRGQVNRLT